MPFETTAQVISEVNRLMNSWARRSTEVKKWYRLIRLHNDLHQQGMESVISNDPRTSFDMALWLLNPRTPKFLVQQDNLTDSEAAKAVELETYAMREYTRWREEGRSELHGSQENRSIALMLATGWYAVGSMPMPDGKWNTQVFNPMSLYPEYDEGGCLVGLGRSYTITGAQAKSKILKSGWKQPAVWWKGNVAVRSLWKHNDEGVWQAITIGNMLVKPMEFTPFIRIPIMTGPVAGLPDDGSIMGDDSWKGEIGQSVVTPMLDVQKNYDKMLSYMQQLLRDTANPRVLEQVRGRGVVTIEQWRARGAIFSVEPGENISTIAPPPLPPEMRSHQFDLRKMTSRATFPDTAFGNVEGQVSSVLMTQIIAAAQRVLFPFQDTHMFLMGALATLNFHHMQHFGIGLKTPNSAFPSFPEDVRVRFRYDITVPGDFVQRSSVARILNPEFRLSQATIYDVMFPEVQSALLEEGRLNAEDANRDPIFKAMITINEMMLAASEARTAGDPQFAVLLEQAAALMQQRTFQPQSPGGDAVSATGGGLPLDGMNPVFQELLSGR